MKLNLVEGRQIELLYLIYIHAGGFGDSTYSINLKDICTVDAGYALWFIAAEDLNHEGWIELTGSQLEDAIASITPTGRKQAREWERQYDLDQRLVSIKTEGDEGQTGNARYWVNFTPIQSGPTFSSGDEVTLDRLKIGYVIYDGNVKDALHYVTLRTGGKHDIYVSHVEEKEQRADIHLSSERQREANNRPPTDESRHIKWGDGWPTSDVEIILSVGSIHISRLNERRTQVAFVAWTEDSARFADYLIEKMRVEDVVVPFSKPLPQNISPVGVASEESFGQLVVEGEPDGAVTDRLIDQANKSEEQAKQYREQAQKNLARMEEQLDKSYTSDAALSELLMPKKSKRGPRTRTKQEKIEAVKAWDNLDRDQFAITLDDWLDERFGNTGGKLNVPTSTFHGWRRYLNNS